MPAPSQPSLTLTYLSSSSFQANIVSDVGVTNRLFYSPVGTPGWTTGPTVVGSGSDTVNVPVPSTVYNVYVISDSGSSFSQPTFSSISLTQSDELSSAFLARFNSFPNLVQAIKGGLWLGEVPEGTATPYAWMEVSKIESLPLLKGLWEFGRVLVHIYGPGAQTVQDCARQFKTAFDYQGLTFQSKDCVSLMPLSYQLRCEALRNSQGQLMFRAVLLYRVHMDTPG